MAESKIDPEIRIKPSENFLHFIQNYLDEDCPKLPSNLLGKQIQTLSISDVTWIENYMSQNGSELQKSWPQFKYFHELMEESTMVLPEPQIPARNPVLDARIERLKGQQAERDYKRMTQNVSGRPAYTEEPLANQMQEINSHLIMVLQLVVSVATAFVFGYMAPYFFYGIDNAGTRILIGIFCAFVVFVADLYFVMRFLLETEGNIKRPTSPSKTSSAQKTTNLVKNDDKSGSSVKMTTTNLIEDEDSNFGSGDIFVPSVATKPKIE